MIGLMFLVAALVYLLITVLVTWLAVRAARRRGIAGWKWGLPALLVMYLLVFWDWIPTDLAHKYYCSRYGGFTVRKALDQWKAENPGVAETLAAVDGVESTQDGGRTRYVLNQRFVWEKREDKKIFGIREADHSIIDTKTGETVAAYTDFDTDIRPMGLGPRNLRDYKFWLKWNSCEADGEKVARTQFYSLMSAYKHGKEKSE